MDRFKNALHSSVNSKYTDPVFLHSALIPGVSLVFLFVPALFVLLVLQGGPQLLDEDRQHLVQRIHHPPLQPLGNCSPGMVEAQFLQDVIHADGIYFPPRPGDEPES